MNPAKTSGPSDQLKPKQSMAPVVTRSQTQAERRKKLDVFLEAFDLEVKERIEIMTAKRNDILKQSQDAYDMALAKLPMDVRQRNWLEYYRSEKANDQGPVDRTDVAAKVDTVLAAEVHDVPPPGKERKAFSI